MIKDLIIAALATIIVVAFAVWSEGGIRVSAAVDADPDCTLISQEGTLRTSYCYNPENNKFYYRNNLGFMMKDEE